MLTKSSMIFSLGIGLHNYLLNMVEEIFEKSLGINSSHISYTSQNSHILEIYIKICIFSNI